MQTSNHFSDERVQSSWQALLQQTARMPQVSPLLLRGYHALVARAQCIYDHLRRQPRAVRRRLQRQLGTSLAGAALALALANAPAQAASITVDGTTCTLVEAITSANNDNAAGNGCVNGSGADTITLSADVTLIASNVYAYYSDVGLPLVSSQITIEGAGHTIARSAAGGTPEFCLLVVTPSGNLTLNNSTLTGGRGGAYGGGAIFNTGAVTVSNSTLSGNSASYGGAIFNRGTVTVSNSTLSGNSVSVDGGGLHNAGTLTVSNSTFSGNGANFSGGGISNTSTATVSNSTLSGNSAVRGGGGIFNFGTMTMSNSTLSGNSAANYSGGIYNTGTLMVSNSTLSGNSSYYGGGLFNFGTVTVSNSTLSRNSAQYGGGLFNVGTLTLQRSLVSGNTAGDGAEISNFNGTINSANFNLIGYGGSARSSNFTPSGSDIVPSQALAAILNTTLANNGGPTLTHALVGGSPAIDAAGDGPLATDQRGVTRPQGVADDIGAFEVKDLTASVTQGTPTTSNNPTPQPCAATGTNLAIYTINTPLTNSSANTFTDLFFRVKQLEYTTPQGGAVPSLCNATTVVNSGGAGSILAVPNSTLPGGNSQFNPGETLTQAFEVGRPVAAQFRIKVDLFSSSAAAAHAEGSAGEEYLGSFEYVFDPTAEGFTPVQQLFLPLVVEN